MNAILNVSSGFVMSSLDFLNEVINPARAAAGEKPVRPSDFHSRVNDEIGENLNYENFVVGKTGHKTFYTTLNIDQMLLVGMRESKAVRRSVINTLKELQDAASKSAPPVPQTMGEALRLAADLWEEKERLALENKEMTPKADVYDRIVERNGLYNATQIAQKFGQSAIWLNKQLASMGVYNRSVKRGRVFQQWFIDSGYGIMRETENGFSQPMFYAEGEMWIVRKLSEEGLI
uniref:Antirepressor protein C-terminal domain-containing protein n=1 Tax=Klebsiella phage KpTDp1 TaxID=3161143 RepID=A0AAU7YQQ8_9CAUD